MAHLSRPTIGILLGVLASVLWGAVFVAGRYLIDVRGLEPMFVASLRFNIGWMAALLFLLSTGRGASLIAATRELPLLVGLGALGIFGMGTGVFMAVNYTSSINASIICNANPIFIVLFAPLIGERVPVLRALGVFVGLAGCIVVSLGDLAGAVGGSNDLLGCGFATLAAVCWAAYTVLGKGVSLRRGGLETSCIAMIAGGLMYLPVAISRGGIQPLDGTELAIALFLGVGPTAVAMLAWYKALEFVDANALGPTQYIATIVGTVLGCLLLGEQIGWTFGVGGAAIILGLWLATRPKMKTRS